MSAVASPSRPSRSHVSSPVPHFNADTPRKRRKYVPGGPGGGGRWEDTDQLETPRTRPSRIRSGRPVGRPRTVGRPRRPPPPAQPMRSSTSAEAAAAIQSDGYKPREERGWEEFHPDLDIDADLTVFTADEVDGIVPDDNKENSELIERSVADDASEKFQDSTLAQTNPSQLTTPMRRRPGRPPRRPDTILFGLGSPTPPRILPLPAQNPRERLNLPKPSYKRVETFAEFEQDRANQINFVDRPMAAVGFQESEMYFRKDKSMVRLNENRADEDPEPNLVLEGDKDVQSQVTPVINKVEYDMDEQDQQWLDFINVHRREEGVDGIKPAIFEITMTQIEKEWHALEKRIPKPNPKPPQTSRPRSSSAAAVNGETGGEEQDSKCAICDDGDCENTNAIVFCDGCDLAVHQECYGVPFIPEGQWLCRKCQFIGRSTPTCIFCPNTEGAFKLTTQQKWAHLLCSIWIPEVSIANATFMEPIEGVQSVPKNRWKLVCYICNQRMGACIQCGNRSCFAAFHVTCARRAKLYLKMKSAHGGPANLDASVLKALCDKHVPSEWRQQYDVETATAEAKSFYRRTLKGRRWADSATSALSQTSAPQVSVIETVEDTETTDQQKETAAQKRKKLQALQKNIWRLPSGAPIVPHVVFNAVESALVRFTIRKRKEFVAEACKYWTLKREARRGAALLKRLQLQMETFSTTEITRRNFSAMGAIGGPKLRRRIDFAEQLLQDLARIRFMCESVKDREAKKLSDVELLTKTVDTVYFPILALLWPVIERAVTLDPKKVFADGFKRLQTKLEERQYTSVAEFSVDLGSVFKNVAGLDSINDAVEAHNQLLAAPIRDSSLSGDEREAKRLAKRIVKAVQQPLQDALKKEAELSGRPFEKEMESLELLLTGTVGEDFTHAVSGSQDVEMTDVDQALTQIAKLPSLSNGDVARPASPASIAQEVEGATSSRAGEGATQAGIPNSAQKGPPTPPRSEDSLHATFSAGGIPWYLEPFDVSGTTIHDERWTGRDVLRGLSEELSDIDENELADLGGDMPKAGEALKETETVAVVKRSSKRTKRRR